MSKLYVIGLGPGAPEQMTYRARMALEDAEVLCGYSVYVNLVKEMFPQKKSFATPMGQEQERCRWALTTARQGKTVALLCSGDAGIYGMAGPLLEMAEEKSKVDIEIIPGVTAALAGASLLGAPLMNDFCVISLSDLLTPWEIIAKRLECAAAGDFVVVLYNPASKQRTDHLKWACDLLLTSRTPETVCGWVRNIDREGQQSRILTLAELRNEKLDMFTTVFIGSKATNRLGDWMVTARGYENKI